MSNPCESCPQERVHELEYRVLGENLKELKERVSQVEAAMSRGVMLLVANLAGVVMSLAKGFLQS